MKDAIAQLTDPELHAAMLYLGAARDTAELWEHPRLKVFYGVALADLAAERGRRQKRAVAPFADAYPLA